MVDCPTHVKIKVCSTSVRWFRQENRQIILWLTLIYLSLFSHYVGGCQVGQFHKASLWGGRLIQREPWKKIQYAAPKHAEEKLPRIKGQRDEVTQRWIQQGFPFKTTKGLFVISSRFSVASAIDLRMKKMLYPWARQSAHKTHCWHRTLQCSQPWKLCLTSRWKKDDTNLSADVS